MKHVFFTFLLGAVFCMGLQSQEMAVDYTVGEKFGDRHRYSNTLVMQHDHQGNTVVVRNYYAGVVLRPKGYLIEIYDKDLNLAAEFNYKLKDVDFVEGYVKNGQIYLIFLKYDFKERAYQYEVHRSPLGEFNFGVETLLSIPSEPVGQPYDRNYYNRNFGSGFTTTLLTDLGKSGFVISTHFKKGKDNRHYIHVFDHSLNKVMEHDFSSQIETKNYSFENVAISHDLKDVYIVGKAYFKKKRFQVNERKFQYELLHLDAGGIHLQTFNEPGKFPESLIPIRHQDHLYCVGFYADRKDHRYNGLVFYDLDPITLSVGTKRYNAFTEQFMEDKFGREVDKEIKNLVFKNALIDTEGNILFNAEEYFVTESTQDNVSGGRIRVKRFHHNDIICAKMSASGNMLWARNINKTEVTQGDGAYVSYSSHAKDGNTLIFMSSAAEQPQLLPGERLFFKQGLGRNRNLFVITLSPEGKIGYQKIIDDKEARLPIMVAIPLIDTQKDEMVFYAKRGSKKQLVKMRIK